MRFLRCSAIWPMHCCADMKVTPPTPINTSRIWAVELDICWTNSSSAGSAICMGSTSPVTCFRQYALAQQTLLSNSQRQTYRRYRYPTSNSMSYFLMRQYNGVIRLGQPLKSSASCVQKALDLSQPSGHKRFSNGEASSNHTGTIVYIRSNLPQN